MRTEVPTVRYAAALLHKVLQVQSEDHNWSTSINGTSPDYFTIRDWPVVKGSLLTQADVDSRTGNAVVGQTVVGKLFGPSFDPVGQTIRINNVPFVIIGVLESKGQSMQGQDSDDVVFIPGQLPWQSRKSEGSMRINGSIMVSCRFRQAYQRAVSR